MDEKLKKTEKEPKNKLFWGKNDDLEKITSLFKKNEVLITSTDTIPGFLAKISQETFDKISLLKGKREDKPFLLLVSTFSQLMDFIDAGLLDEQKMQLLETCWPGPLTVIFKALPNTPTYVAPWGKVAIRIPNHKGLLWATSHFGGLFSTSANRSQAPAPRCIDEVDSELAQSVLAIVDDKQHPHVNALPSTIIDFSCENTVTMVREGAYTQQELEDIYESDFE